MLINLRDIKKEIGTRTLFEGLNLTLQPGEKVGLIGRNGVGKTTLLGILDGTDTGFEGEIDRRRGLTVVSTAQEHADVADQVVLDYILDNLPEYAELKGKIETLSAAMSGDMQLITDYTTALERFGELGYHDIEERVLRELSAYQIERELALGPIEQLSGGQKRFVELVKVTLSGADVALIDEPTNHMDTIAKDTFIAWLRDSPISVMVITHDRDVLSSVDRIIELRAGSLLSFPGSYEAYLRQNSQATVREIGTYEQGQKRLAKIEKQIKEAQRRKAGWSGTADKTNPFMLLERRLTKEKEELQARLEKPSFWIDQENVGRMSEKATVRYEKYKARNIRLDTTGSHRDRRLITADALSLGYGEPLFDRLDLSLQVGEHLRVLGRNGAGKSTLAKRIIATVQDVPVPSKGFAGSLTVDPRTTLGVYEQEISERYLSLPLALAVSKVYEDADRPVTEQRVRQTLAQYLFDWSSHHRLPISKLSGGEKARFQLIKMLAGDPNLLILDEPTNHLDLPSIEELEKALAAYEGAILYVSHDSYFARKLGGVEINIERLPSEASA